MDYWSETEDGSESSGSSDDTGTEPFSSDFETEFEELESNYFLDRELSCDPDERSQEEYSRFQQVRNVLDAMDRIGIIFSVYTSNGIINGMVFPAPVPAITTQSRPRTIASATSICQSYGVL
jgi:hypothetical protein